MTEYQLTLRDGSKRFEFAQDTKEVRLLLWMHDGVCAVPVTAFPGSNEVTFAASRLRLERDCDPTRFVVSRKRFEKADAKGSQS